jgi:predicted secreted protein
MPTKAIAGVGTLFRRWTGTAWETVAEITNITGPSMSRETIDVTSLDTTGGFREFIPSFKDPGTVNLTMNFTQDGILAMNTDFNSALPTWYEIVLPDDSDGSSLSASKPTAILFKGLVQELPLTIPTDAQVTMDVVIKVTGSVSIHLGATTGTPV